MDDEKAVYNLNFDVRGERLEVQARVPRQSVRVSDLLPIVHGLAQVTVDAAAGLAEDDGRTVSCRAGCAACCRQVIPISPSEARYLADLVDGMPAERREKVRARFRETLDALEQAGLGDDLRRIQPSDDDATRLDLAHRYFDQRIDCPFLEDERCSIYLHRPLACREYLVTSPSHHCDQPTSETVKRVPMPIKLSGILNRFEDGEGKGEPRSFPLVLTLEWADAQGDVARTFAGTELFENFVTRIGEVASRGEPAAS